MLNLLCFITILAVWATATTLPSPLLVTYWGQDVNPPQQPLRSYCDLGYNVVVLGFIDQFGNETLHMQMDSVSCSMCDTDGCDAIASNITYCQNHNVKILMSMGGGTVHDCPAGGCKGEYRFDSAVEADSTAEEMYFVTRFFAGTANNSYWRPFKDVQLDGVDLDIEETTAVTPEGIQTYQWYYDVFITKLRELQGQNELIVSAAPECHHGCASGNCNPLEQTVNLTAFDYLFVQFYNDKNCSLIKPEFNSSLDYWLNLNGQNSNVTIVLGVPGDNRSIDVTDPEYFVQPEQVVSIYKDKHSQNRRVDGIGIWQASTDPKFFTSIQQGLENTANTNTPNTANPTKSGSALEGRRLPRTGIMASLVLLGLLV